MVKKIDITLGKTKNLAWKVEILLLFDFFFFFFEENGLRP